MTETELRALYTEAVKIIRAERRMRAYAFRDKERVLTAKLAEIDRLLAILEQIKDAAKVAVSEEQMALIPPPVKYD
jgi:hypothetical protein